MDADYVKAVMCEARLMNDAAGKGAELKKMYTKVRGKYAVQELCSLVFPTSLCVILPWSVLTKCRQKDVS